jgi:hypothetical protein
MRYGLLIGLLSFGAIAGFGAGFARVYHHHRGDVCDYRGGRLERRAAEACTRATLDLLEQRKTPAPNR